MCPTFQEVTQCQKDKIKYTHSKDNVTFEEIITAAELFKKQTVTIIPDHSHHFSNVNKEINKINTFKELKKLI
jgi:predicted esterase YcpF (UPF0227 family)